MSTFLTLEYHKIQILSSNAVSESEKLLLNDIMQEDPHSTILSLTPKSKSITEYKLFNHNIGYYSDQIWPSSSPELPMNILNGLNTTALIFLSNQDFVDMTMRNYWNGYLGYHVLANAPSIEKNSTIGKIVKIPKLSPPTSFSEMVLILPNDISPSQYYAYDILSLGQYNFTTALLSDIASIKNAKILVAPTEDIANTLIQSKDDLDLDFNNLIILNLDGYGQIGKVEGQYLDPHLNSTDTIQYMYRNDDFSSNIITYSRQYDNPVDLSEYDFMNFNWQGHGKDQDHAIEFSSNSGGTITYHFTDSWIGSKQILFPMDLSYTNSGFDNIYIEKNNVNDEFWHNISDVNILTSDPSTSSDNSINLDDMQFISKVKTEALRSVKNNEVLELNHSSIIPSNYPSSYNVISTFDNNIPYILLQKEPDYNIHYVNVYPLLRNIEDENQSPVEMYSLYGELLDGLEADLPKYMNIQKDLNDLVKEAPAAFRNGTFTGDVTIQSTSSTIDTETIISKINVDGTNSDLSYLSRIIPLYVDQVKIKSNSSTISGVYGFYAALILPGKTIVSFIGNPAIISLSSLDGKEKIIYGGNITLTLDNANALSRQPDINVTGVSNFSQFYSYGDLNYKIGSRGSDLEITGKSQISTKYADEFILVDKINLDGEYETDWTDYFKDNPNVNLLDTRLLFKTETFGYILFLILMCCVYNVYISQRKHSIKFFRWR
jgi:hypothetical protein